MHDGIIQDLMDEFGRPPGIGPESVERIAFHILQTGSFDATRLVQLLIDLREKVRFCWVCGNVAEQPTCSICRDPRGSPWSTCVVEEAKNVVAIERTRESRGPPHVLGGAISPIEAVGPDDLCLAQLLGRLGDNSAPEVSVATDPDLEGETAAT